MVSSSAPLWRLTVDDFERMGEAGILRDDDRVELIDGLLVEMSPIGKKHGSAVIRGNYYWMSVLGDRAIVSVQGPVRIGESSQLQPDFAVLKPREDFYASAYAEAEDVLLIVEVADSSLLLDRNQKVPVYAREGVKEVWLVNLLSDVVEVFRRPEQGAYQEQFVVERGQELSPLAFPELRVKVEELTGA